MCIKMKQRAIAPAVRTGRAVLLSLAASLCGASYVHAEGLSAPVNAPANLSDRIDMKLTGRLETRCLLSGGGDIDLGELKGGQGVQAQFGLECNVPFDIDIHSARGGLAHATHPEGQGPFSGLLEYDLSLTVPTLRPTPGVVRGAYGSRQLRTHAKLTSGDGISAGNGSIEFRMRAPEGAGLLAGRYTETLSMTVSPRM